MSHKFLELKDLKDGGLYKLQLKEDRNCSDKIFVAYTTFDSEIQFNIKDTIFMYLEFVYFEQKNDDYLKTLINDKIYYMIYYFLKEYYDCGIIEVA